MRHIARGLFYLLCAVIFIGCDKPVKRAPASMFSVSAPQNYRFKKELRFLETVQPASTENRTLIEKDLVQLEKRLGIPRALLWCVLFQESRFDPFKNAKTQSHAKGLGQFTTAALEEINLDRNHFDPRTEEVLDTELKLGEEDINFKLKEKPLSNSLRKSGYLFPPQLRTSYYHVDTAVYSSGIYLNNRYRQLQAALDRQGITYDPQVLWIFAAAAYNKGSRAVYAILNHLYMSRGEQNVTNLLNDPRAAQTLLTHPKLMDYSLRKVWPASVRSNYLKELTRNMNQICSCALAEDLG